MLKLKENCKMRICALLMNADILEAEEGLIHIVFNSLDETSKQYLQQDESKRAVKEAVIDVTQKEYKVKYVFGK